VLICVIGVAAFILADAYHVNPLWLFLAWNSVGLVAAVGWGFRSHWKRPAFIAFFTVWLTVHAAVVTVLMGWVPIVYWLPLFFLELFIGYLFAYWLFGVPLDHEQ
jgi:hypothetical protein